MGVHDMMSPNGADWTPYRRSSVPKRMEASLSY